MTTSGARSSGPTAAGWGTCSTPRLVADGPPLGAFGPALRLHDLIVGRGSLGARLGLDRERVRGPWLLKVLFARRQLHRVPWDAIAEIRDDTITLSIAADQLPGSRSR